MCTMTWTKLEMSDMGGLRDIDGGIEDMDGVSDIDGVFYMTSREARTKLGYALKLGMIL